MRGKKGPVPPVKEKEKPAEETVDLTDYDPTAEEIVGAENVVNVVDADPEFYGEISVSDPTLPRDHISPLAVPGYKCADCTFTSMALSEIEEHCNGTQHGGYKTATQPQLFSEPGVVHRNVEVPIDPDVLNEKRAKLAELYQEALEVKANKKSADAAFNAQLTAIDEDMQAIARILKSPFTYTRADCEWRIIDGENARGLYRLDTGELIEKAALTEEDRAAELKRAEEANAETVNG